MIEHELILLGLLRESPRHGYEIKKQVKEIFSLLAGIDLKSVYYPLRILEKKGLLLKRSSKEGKRPERLVYELTPKGEARFRELLNKSFLDFKRPQFSLDLSLYFLNYINPKIAKRRLRARMRVLEGLSSSIRYTLGPLKKKRSLALAHILEHNLEMLETESKFLSRLTTSL
jgi:DNA-binding PadR family transcriptional regulator